MTDLPLDVARKISDAALAAIAAAGLVGNAG